MLSKVHIKSIFAVYCSLQLLVIGASANGGETIRTQNIVIRRIEELIWQHIEKWDENIIHYCEILEVDSRMIKAILFTEKIQYELDGWLQLKKAFEDQFYELWLFVEKPAIWADLSMGYSNIKPSFAKETHVRSKAYALPLQLTENEIDPFTYLKDPEKAIKIMVIACKVLEVEWERHQIDLSDRPEIIATLFNIGYKRSQPNSTPKSGGSTYPVAINGTIFQNICFGDRVKMVMEHSTYLKE